MRFRYLSLLILLIIVIYLHAWIKMYTDLKIVSQSDLERNFSILVAKNNETISKNNYTLGNAGFLPSIDLSGRYSGTLNNTTLNMTDGTQTSTNGVFNTTTSAVVALGLTIFQRVQCSHNI